MLLLLCFPLCQQIFSLLCRSGVSPSGRVSRVLPSWLATASRFTATDCPLASRFYNCHLHFFSQNGTVSPLLVLWDQESGASYCSGGEPLPLPDQLALHLLPCFEGGHPGSLSPYHIIFIVFFCTPRGHLFSTGERTGFRDGSTHQSTSISGAAASSLAGSTVDFFWRLVSTCCNAQSVVDPV